MKRCLLFVVLFAAIAHGIAYGAGGSETATVEEIPYVDHRGKAGILRLGAGFDLNWMSDKIIEDSRGANVTGEIGGSWFLNRLFFDAEGGISVGRSTYSTQEGEIRRDETTPDFFGAIGLALEGDQSARRTTLRSRISESHVRRAFFLGGGNAAIATYDDNGSTVLTRNLPYLSLGRYRYTQFAEVAADGSVNINGISNNHFQIVFPISRVYEDSVSRYLIPVGGIGFKVEDDYLRQLMGGNTYIGPFVGIEYVWLRYDGDIEDLGANETINNEAIDGMEATRFVISFGIRASF